MVRKWLSRMSGADWSTTPRSSRPGTLRCPRPCRRTSSGPARGGPTWSAPSWSPTPPCPTSPRPSRSPSSSPAAPARSPARSATRPSRRSRLAGLEIALRDPDDLAGNARRVVAAVDAARAEGAPRRRRPRSTSSCRRPRPTTGWLAAADVVAEGEHRLKFRTGGLEADKFPAPATVAGWIDAALDRETPFKCTAGLHHAIAHRDHATGFEHHGFLNVLLATRQAFDGATQAEVATLLADHYPNDLVALARSNSRATWPARAAGSPRSAAARSGSRSTTWSGWVSSRPRG